MTSAGVPTFATRLRGGETLLGAWCSFPTAGVAEQLAAGGVDFVAVDLQHGLASEGDLPALFAAVEARGALPAARLRANDPVELGRVLDLGAQAVFVPNVDTADAAARAVAASRYAPRGTRSFGPRRASLSLADVEDVAVVIQIESAAAVADVETIAAVEGIAGLYVGPWDLSVSLGLSYPEAAGDPRLAEAILRVRSAADAGGIPAGVHSIDGDGAARMLEAGWRLAVVADDITLLRDGTARELARALEGRR